MRDALILLAFCFTCYPRLLAQTAPASIEGIVVNSATGAPLSRVHLNLSSPNPEEVDAPSYGALSNDAGRFLMAAIQPGVEYRLDAQLAGFVLYPTVEQAPSGVIVHTFKPREHVTAYRIELAPRVAITGRILDESGEPLPHMSVVAQRVRRDSPTHAAPLAFATSDERGIYRLSVAPERYQVVATQHEGRDESELRVDGSVDQPYLPTYYPSTLSRDAAGVVDAQSGTIAGIDIRPLHSTMLHINGTVSGIPPDPSHLRVVIENSERMQQDAAHPGPDGQFSFSSLEPGAYGLYAQANTPEGPLRTPVVELKLTTSSVDFVPLALSRGFDVHGMLAGVPPDGRSVSLIGVRSAAETLSGPTPSSTVAADGSFVIKGVQPGEYELQIELLPDAAYVKSLQLGRTAAVDSVIDLRGGSTSAVLAVTVSPAGGRISGSLVGQNGEPLRRLGFVYVLEDGKDWSPRHRHGEPTNADGEFTVPGLPPGKYRVFATVYGVTPFGTGADRIAGMLQYAAAAGLVEVHEGEKIVTNVKVAGAR